MLVDQPGDTELSRVFSPDHRVSLGLSRILEILPEVAQVGAHVDEELVGWVKTARTAGASWQQVADVLGVTRQSAWERFSRRVSS
ncbi:hypothetical protein [Microbacterium protaetiae]|uniref:hypothetical protein n=1 Tax=Microbacterium protaetiae TaxID=2509458 RepID=UPI001F5C3BD0|nr:hypothetical protein [Microbacterium protaetiae]